MLLLLLLLLIVVVLKTLIKYRADRKILRGHFTTTTNVHDIDTHGVKEVKRRNQ